MPTKSSENGGAGMSTQGALNKGGGSTSDAGTSIKVGKRKKVVIAGIKKAHAPNVIYIGHLPKECEERELIAFLKQFGRLIQVRLCRSHKTGGTKGYAFAKFQSSEVAAIVAETMNGHLLFQKRLVSHVLAPDQIHANLFSKNTRTVFQRKAISKETDPKSIKATAEEVSRRLLEREQQKRDKLKSLGIEYDFPGFSAELTMASKSAVEDDKESRNISKLDKKTANKETECKANTPKEKPKRKRSLSGDDGKHDSPKDADKTPTESHEKGKRNRSPSREEEDVEPKVADTPKVLKKTAIAKTASKSKTQEKQSHEKAKRKQSLSRDKDQARVKGSGVAFDPKEPPKSKKHQINLNDTKGKQSFGVEREQGEPKASVTPKGQKNASISDKQEELSNEKPKRKRSFSGEDRERIEVDAMQKETTKSKKQQKELNNSDKRKRSVSGELEQLEFKVTDVPKEISKSKNQEQQSSEKAKRKHSFIGEEQASVKEADTPNHLKETHKSKRQAKELVSPKSAPQHEKELPQSEKKSKKKNKKAKKRMKSFP